MCCYSQRYSSDLPKGGLEVPCLLIFSINDAISTLLTLCQKCVMMKSPSTDVIGVIEKVEEEQGRMSDRIVENSKLTSSEGDQSRVRRCVYYFSNV